MKKFVVIMLLMVYSASSFGMTVHFHFCCGKLKSVDFAPAQPKHCAGGKEHKMGSKSCCDNKEVSLKISGDQDPAKALQPFCATNATKAYGFNFFVSHPAETKNLLPEIFAPPPLEKDRNHFYCIYRI